MYGWKAKRKTSERKREKRKIELCYCCFKDRAICMFTVLPILGKNKMFEVRRNTLGKKYVFILQATDHSVVCINLIFGLCLVNLNFRLKGEVFAFLSM